MVHRDKTGGGSHGLARGKYVVAVVAAVVVVPSNVKTIWEVGKPQGHVEVLEGPLPSPKDFFDKYMKNLGGPFEKVGKPVLLKGAAKSMPAYSLWTDEYLREKHGSVSVDQVETEKKETRTALPHEDWDMAKFLDNYKTSNIYSVSSTPKGLADEVYLLPIANCGGYHARMAQTVTWMSSGSTQSVIHNDGNHNIHCMVAGKKDWILWDPRVDLQRPEFGWVSESEDKSDPAFNNIYGAFVGRIDVQNVDLEKYPAWDRLKWWSMTLNAGDCAFIPGRWFHFVEAPAQRAISVHAWFVGKKFDQKSCDKLEAKGYNVSDFLFRFSDCTWGYGETTKKTRCKPQKSLKLTVEGQEL